MTDISLTIDDLTKQLSDQLEILKILADNYDKGNIIVAKPMATTIRVLLHDTGNSHSLLGQLKMKGQNFFDSTKSIFVNQNPDIKKIGSYSGIVGMGVGGEAIYVPYLDDVPDDAVGFVDFDVYWNRTILIDNNGMRFSRKDVILTVANKDGGAHVDSILDKKYVDLIRNNSMGWETNENDNPVIALKNIESANVRQIAHEILRTLDPRYPKRKMVHGSWKAVLGGGIVASKESFDHIHSHQRKIIGRNDPCPCGNGKKFKKCHGF